MTEYLGSVFAQRAHSPSTATRPDSTKCAPTRNAKIEKLTLRRDVAAVVYSSSSRVPSFAASTDSK